MNSKLAVRHILGILSIILLFVSCDKKGKETENTIATQKGEYTIYYPEKDNNRLCSYVYKSDEENDSRLVDELINELKKGDYENSKEPVFFNELGEVESKLDYKGILTFNFSTAYQTMESIEEMLFRASVVKTMCQLETIKGVEFLVADQPLIVKDGEVIITALEDESSNQQEEELLQDYVVGIMNAYDFVNNIGSEKDEKQEDILTLYYANENGDKLEISYVKVTYDINVSMEEIVALQMIEGPVSANCYETINAATKINNIVTKDNVCYIDLSEEFLVMPQTVTKEVCVYSMVNSLLELSKIKRVQISVEGEVFTGFAKDGLMDRNYELINNP